MNSKTKELENQVKRLDEKMKKCKPGEDFSTWRELNEKKANLELELHRLRVLGPSDEELKTRLFFQGINKARNGKH